MHRLLKPFVGAYHWLAPRLSTCEADTPHEDCIPMPGQAACPRRHSAMQNAIEAPTALEPAGAPVHSKALGRPGDPLRDGLQKAEARFPKGRASSPTALKRKAPRGDEPLGAKILARESGGVRLPASQYK
jgi:hypothetical protein